MTQEFAIKQADFWRLCHREQFLLLRFNAYLHYRLPATKDEYIYVKVDCSDETAADSVHRYILSYIEPKYSRSIPYPQQYKTVLCDPELLNRLMKEYLVHIEIEDETNSHMLKFYSLTLTVLFLAIDDFRKAISNVVTQDNSMITEATAALSDLTLNFEGLVETVEEEYSSNEEEKEETVLSSVGQKPNLTVSFPGAQPNARETSLDSLVVKDKPGKRSKRRNKSRNKNPLNPPLNPLIDNDLVLEMRQKLQGRTLRHVIIDGANVGRTYGGSEFSARGIKLAVDLFQSYGYPDSQIVVIVPSHYLSKDDGHVFQDLLHRKIIHRAFHQKTDAEVKRFYDDRLIVDIAVIRKGVILSNDFYRDLLKDSGEAVRKTIRERLLCYRFIGDDLCLPNPVGEKGPPLDKFLSM